jgi:uncharacterized membrane protein YeaQ/YmgE (transglycosylase-associated protein family)
METILINLISGAVGGNVAGAVMKENSLGTIGNSIAGIVGGGIGGQILSMVLGAGAVGGGLSLAGILGSVASGGIGGGIGLVVVGLIKSMMNKS